MKKITMTFIFLMLSLQNAFAQNPTIEEAQQIIDEVLAIYGPIHLEQRKKELVVELLKNSNSTYIGINRFHEMKIHAGYLKVNGMTNDAFALSLCHEVGHVLGGKPYVIPPKTGFSSPLIGRRSQYKNFSVEGQSDYYATAHCLKEYFAKKDNKAFVESQSEVPGEAFESCNNFFQSEKDYYICVRSQIASVNWIKAATIIASRIDNTQYQVPSISKKSQAVTNRTLNYEGEYPSLQCRLDTLIAGSLCTPSESKFNCLEEETKRPVCWHK